MRQIPLNDALPRAWHRRARGRHLPVLLLALFSLVLGGGVVQAWASPDLGRTVLTRTHVDAPVPFYDAAHGRLSIKAGGHDPQDVVLWLGQTRAGGPVPANLFVVPGRDQRLDFLGEAGTVYNAAPQNVDTSQEPIFAGVGVDPSVTEAAADGAFEDGTYALDLVGVEGPGHVEVFKDTGGLIRRLYSSRDSVHRSIFFPRHDHMYTLFSKPGRYTLYYRAVARSAEGDHALIASEPTPIVWQVGGTSPVVHKVSDLPAAFAQAPQQGEGGHGLTLRPAPQELRGGAYKTEIAFSTGNPADEGTLVLTIDGHHLSELEVTGGQAVTYEALGSDSATIQAVYLPAQGPASRWASAPRPYRAADGEVTVSASASQLQAPTAGTGLLDYATRTVSSRRVDFSLSPDPARPGHSVVRLSGMDPALSAGYRVSLHDPEDHAGDRFPACSFEGAVVGGQDVVLDLDGCQRSALLKVEVRPHPAANVRAVVHSVSDPAVSTGLSAELELPLREGGTAAPPDQGGQGGQGDQGGDQGAPGEQPGRPLPDDPAPSVPEQGLDATKVTIEHGHLDLRLVKGQDGQGHLIAVKDDSGRRSVLREVGAVTLKVGEGFAWTRSAELTDPSYDVVGAVGQKVYVVPESQVTPNQLWPGFSTEGVDYSGFPEGLDYEMTLLEGPAGGRVVFGAQTLLGAGFTTYLNTADASQNRLRTSSPTHLHGAWVFSHPGTYRLSLRAVTGTPARQVTEPVTLTVVVGADSQAGPENPNPAPTPGKEPGTGPTASPTPTPTPTAGAGATQRATAQASASAAVTPTAGGGLASRTGATGGGDLVAGTGGTAPQAPGAGAGGKAAGGLARTGASGWLLLPGAGLALLGGAVLWLRRRPKQD